MKFVLGFSRFYPCNLVFNVDLYFGFIVLNLGLLIVWNISIEFSFARSRSSSSPPNRDVPMKSSYREEFLLIFGFDNDSI